VEEARLAARVQHPNVVAPLDVVAVVEPLVAETALGFRTRRSAAE